jgi:hypothetical protein
VQKCLEPVPCVGAQQWHSEAGAAGAGSAPMVGHTNRCQGGRAPSAWERERAPPSSPDTSSCQDRHQNTDMQKPPSETCPSPGAWLPKAMKPCVKDGDAGDPGWKVPGNGNGGCHPALISKMFLAGCSGSTCNPSYSGGRGRRIAV